MPSVPMLRPRDVVRAFGRAGREISRRRGSHIFLPKRGSPWTLSIPDRNFVARDTLRTLIARAGLTVGAFLALLEERREPL